MCRFAKNEQRRRPSSADSSCSSLDDYANDHAGLGCLACTYCKDDADPRDQSAGTPANATMSFFTTVPLTPTTCPPSHSAVQLAEEDIEHDCTLHEQEAASMPGTAYVQRLYASDMPATVRSSTVDWLVDAAMQLQLSTDALFLAVQLMDRFMALQLLQPSAGFSHSNSELHLTAIAALWVAAKYEEAIVPAAAAFLQMLPAGTADGQRLLEAEAALLTVLDHRLAKPTPKTFLRRFLFRVAVDRQLYFMCGYLAELALLDGGMLCFLPSVIAAAAYVWALALTGRTCNDQHLSHLTGFKLAQILPCLLRLARVHSAACNTPQPCIISTKYLSLSVEQVAAVPPLSSQELSQLAAQQKQQQQHKHVCCTAAVAQEVAAC